MRELHSAGIFIRKRSAHRIQCMGDLAGSISFKVNTDKNPEAVKKENNIQAANKCMDSGELENRKAGERAPSVIFKPACLSL